MVGARTVHEPAGALRVRGPERGVRHEIDAVLRGDDVRDVVDLRVQGELGERRGACAGAVGAPEEAPGVEIEVLAAPEVDAVAEEDAGGREGVADPDAGLGQRRGPGGGAVAAPEPPLQPDEPVAERAQDLLILAAVGVAGVREHPGPGGGAVGRPGLLAGRGLGAAEDEALAERMEGADPRGGKGELLRRDIPGEGGGLGNGFRGEQGCCQRERDELHQNAPVSPALPKRPAGFLYSLTEPVCVSVTVIVYSTLDRAP